MLYSYKNIEDLENLNASVSLESHVKAVTLQDKLGKQSVHEDTKKLFEPVTKSINGVSEELTKSTMDNSIKNNEAIESLNVKLFKIMNGRGIIASYLLSLQSKITNRGNTSQFKIVKDFNSSRVNDLLIHNTIPVTLYDNLLTFRDTGKEFEFKDLLKMINNKNYNVDLDSLSDKKSLFDFAKEMSVDVKAQCNKCTWDRTLVKMLMTPGLMFSASGV